MNYWKKRMVEAQEAISKKNVNEAQRKLQKYYIDAMKKVISDFEATYDKLKASKDEPTPADLYKLDRYWQMQAQLKEEAQKLGDKEVELLSKSFENEWNEIYKASALPSDTAFSTISKDNAKAMVNTVWCADGKNFSQRVWGKTDKLVERLNESLVHCVITGKKTTELRQMLQREFNVSRNSANTIIRTEIAYIQTQAAAQRYKDHGRKYYEYLGREENDCGHSPDCHALNGKKFLLTEMEVGVNAPPMHPNCRCCIAPVLDKEAEDKEMFDKNNKEHDGYVFVCKYCGKEFEAKYESNFDICPHCGNTNYNLKASKLVYKDKSGNKKYYTKDELKQEAIEMQNEAKRRAAAKTTKGLTMDDAYSTKPFRRQLKSFDEDFVYYHHHCPNCGRWFDSTIEDKKKCPICGSKISYSNNSKVHLRRCIKCGDVFEISSYTSLKYCDKCRTEILTSEEGLKLKKHGYTERGIMNELSEETHPVWSRSELKKSGYDLYREYIKKHPEEEEKLKDISIFDYEKHFVVCADCGEVFFVENKNNAAKRCPKCQAKYRKQYKAQKERERRAKKKNKK